MLIDEMGAKRHVMSRMRLSTLYMMLEDFIADMTVEEYKAVESEMNAVKTAIHQRMNKSE